MRDSYEQTEKYVSYRWLVMLVACIAQISANIVFEAFAPIFEEVAKGLNIQMGSAINITTAFILAAAVSLFFSGMLCDKYGIAALLISGLFCIAIPSALMPWIGHSFTLIIIARLFQGIGGALVFAPIVPILAKWFPPNEQGLVGGLLFGMAPLGTSIGVVASPAILGALESWQKTIAILSIPAWVGLVLTFLVMRRPASAPVASGPAESERVQLNPGQVTLWKAFSYPVTWIGTIIVSCSSWLYYCIYTFVPAYLAAEAPGGAGFGPIMAGKLSIALTVVGLFAVVAGGIFFDKVTKGDAKPAIFIGFIMTGLCTYLLLSPLIYKKLVLLVMCLMIAGWGFLFSTPSISGFIAANYPPNITGSIGGLWWGVGTFIGAAGLYLGGLAIGKTGNFNWAFYSIVIAASIGFMSGFFFKPKVYADNRC